MVTNKIPLFIDVIKEFFFENKTRQCTVYGHSMEPFLTFGEKIEIIPFSGSLKMGHCYAFFNGKALTIHRFVKNSKHAHALFAGDNSLFCDLVPLPNIVGELSPCQKGRALFIIGITNRLGCFIMQISEKNTLLRRLRRQIIRLLARKIKLKGLNHEKRI